MTKYRWLSMLAATTLLVGCGSQDNEGPTVADLLKTNPDNDPYLWLEEVEGEKALGWVETMNASSLTRLEANSQFKAYEEDALSIYNAQDKIAYASLSGDEVHNFWQDASHVRGLWRKASYESYASGAPAWENVLDFDALADAEGENWVYKGRDCLRGTDRCLINLSRGGSDAVVVREFDKTTGTFVEGGFESPESKQWVAWVDADTLMIATNFGDGTMNASGYPAQVRLWKRGTPLADAELLINDPDVVFNFPLASHREDGTYVGVIQGPDFFTQRIHLLVDGELKQLDLPEGISFQGFFRDRMAIQTRKPWDIGGHFTVDAGKLVLADVDAVVTGTLSPTTMNVVGGEGSQSLEAVSIGKDRILLTLLSDVTGSIVSVSETAELTELPMPANGSLRVTSIDDDSDRALINFESMLQPDSLYVAEGLEPRKIYSLPERFDASEMVAEQKFATSKDGTKVPYFVVRPADAKMDGSTPTLLYGYGGFEISLTPSYLGGVSRLWVKEGGAYVVANIRGGGEYGPAWHQAALKENRQRAYDDFIAVAEDLVATGLTSPDKLGIRGGSNGGLLMGVMTTQRPDLWNAVICAVPLLDMYRFDKLLAGDSWVGEYGDPDNPEEWSFIKDYSPYQNVSSDATYPEVFFYTSTKDDRVHPGHARKMARLMLDMGHPVLYYENTEGGHSAAANLKQRAYTDALQMSYLIDKLRD